MFIKVVARLEGEVAPKVHLAHHHQVVHHQKRHKKVKESTLQELLVLLAVLAQQLELRRKLLRIKIENSSHR
jgi:hypothetical protein